MAEAFGQGTPQQYHPLDLIVFESVHLERRKLLACQASLISKIVTSLLPEGNGKVEKGRELAFVSSIVAVQYSEGVK